MIKLDVQDWCQNCANFSPEVISGPAKFYDTEGNLVEIAMSDTVVGCKSRDFCQQVAKQVLNNRSDFGFPWPEEGAKL